MDLSHITAPEPVDDLFAPRVWLVVLGFNNADDTLECIRSIKRSTYPRLTVLYVDNGSRDDEYRRVVDYFSDIPHLRHPENLGVADAFNSGLAHALREGADYAGIVNNDTVFDPEAVTHMVETAQADPCAGIVIPKAYYHGEPGIIWSAGARYRRFPPALILNKTPGEDDGRYDDMPVVEITPYCVCIFRREMLLKTGQLDTVYQFFYEDYDHCLQAKNAGFRVRLAPEASIWHKIGKTIRAKKSEFWRIYGRSHAVFCRKFPGHAYVANPLSLPYLVARTLFEGNVSGLKHFLGGWREGRGVVLGDPVPWDVEE
jgi:hypothetical protein